MSDALRAAVGGMPDRSHPLAAKGKAAATAVGEFILELRRTPGCDHAALDRIAKNLREEMVAAASCIKKGG